MPSRWWIYQRERFPLLAHGPLIAAFSFSAVSFSYLLRAPKGWPAPGSYLVAFVSALLFFLQLRIADECKDYVEDARYRPYRPVPRGLVTLRELVMVGIIAALIQFGLALWLAARGLPAMLVLVWAYLALMSKEFFVRKWIKSRPITYLWTHMLILPLIDLYATACDWTVAGRAPPGLIWFLVVSFFNGVVVEIGRKIRAPSDEEEGVQTYTALWGGRRAALSWLGALCATALCAWRAALNIGFATPVAAVLLVLLVTAIGIAISFCHHPISRTAKLFEIHSGVWTLLLYLSLGAVPLIWRNMKHS